MSHSDPDHRTEMDVAHGADHMGRWLSLVAAFFAVGILASLCYVPQVIENFTAMLHDFDTALPVLTNLFMAVPKAVWYFLFGGGILAVVAVEVWVSTAVVRVLIHLAVMVLSLAFFAMVQWAMVLPMLQLMQNLS